MQDEEDNLVYLGIGPIFAMLLGMALVPLREFTTAANFTLLFVALTIVVAELGGRWPAVLTAIVSAVSLNFFLTKPYLTLRIDDPDDVIAVAGLTLCGLVAATFGSRRRERYAALKATRAQLEVLHGAARHLAETGAAAEALDRVLPTCLSIFPLSAVAVRDSQGRVAAASRRRGEAAPTEQVLEPDTLQPRDGPARASGAVPLPAAGGRLALVSGNVQLGWLELWGDGRPASVEARRTLSDVGRLAAALLARDAARASHP